MSFLENLFFGNVDPQTRAVKPGSRGQAENLHYGSLTGNKKRPAR